MVQGRRQLGGTSIGGGEKLRGKLPVVAAANSLIRFDEVTDFTLLSWEQAEKIS